MIFFRLTRASEDTIPKMDIVIDTRREAGRSPGNVLDLVVGRLLAETISKVVIEDPSKATGVRGELIIDYGNSVSQRSGLRSEMGLVRKNLRINEPYDPLWRDRTDSDRISLVPVHQQSRF